MVSWFKRPGDKALPGNKIQLLRRYYLTCHRNEEDRNTLKHGELPVLADDDTIDIPPPPLPPPDMLQTDDAIPPPAFSDINNVPPPPLPPITAENANMPPNEDSP
jgi:hypothetical protein